jgi:hypothetical protein
MKRMNERLALHKETVRSLCDLDLLNAQGGRINQSRSACAGECEPSPTTVCSEGIVCGTTATEVC